MRVAEKSLRCRGQSHSSPDVSAAVFLEVREVRPNLASNLLPFQFKQRKNSERDGRGKTDQEINDEIQEEGENEEENKGRIRKRK